MSEGERWWKHKERRAMRHPAYWLERLYLLWAALRARMEGK